MVQEHYTHVGTHKETSDFMTITLPDFMASIFGKHLCSSIDINDSDVAILACWRHLLAIWNTQNILGIYSKLYKDDMLLKLTNLSAISFK